MSADAKRGDEMVETFHHWFQQSYPLYERDGRDTTIKRKMEQAWNSAQKASADTIAVLKAKCEKTNGRIRQLEHGYDVIRTSLHRTEAKCVELEKDALRFACVLKHTWVNDQHSLHVYFDLDYDEEMQTRAIALIDAALKERK